MEGYIRKNNESIEAVFALDYTPKNKEYDGYVALAAAILESAEEDMIDAMLVRDSSAIRELRKFYMSPHGQLLSDYRGGQIIERIEREFPSQIITINRAVSLIMRRFALRTYYERKLCRKRKIAEEIKSAANKLGVEIFVYKAERRGYPAVSVDDWFKILDYFDNLFSGMESIQIAFALK